LLQFADPVLDEGSYFPIHFETVLSAECFKTLVRLGVKVDGQALHWA
jgi:hypothetical protein